MARVVSDLHIVPDRNLGRYLQQIRKYPMLAPEEEQRLARSWADDGDVDAAHQLVTSHLRLVAKIAMGYRGYGLPLGELVSEGNVGMMQAVVRFDAGRGFRLATYAMWWIRASIQEYILHSWSLVKMGTTAAQKKLFFNLRKLKGQMQAIEEGDLTPEHVAGIADRLRVAESDVVQMNRRISGPDSSLNAPLREEGEGEWQDWLIDQEESPGKPSGGERGARNAAGASFGCADEPVRPGAPHYFGAPPEGDPDDVGAFEPTLRNIPRTGSTDRGARVRKAAKISKKRRHREAHRVLTPHRAGVSARRTRPSVRLTRTNAFSRRDVSSRTVRTSPPAKASTRFPSISLTAIPA